MTTERDDLIEAVVAARDALHPNLDADFLAEVVAAEADNPDDPDAAVRAIEAALKVSLERVSP